MSTAAPTASHKPGTLDIPRAAGTCAVSARAISPGEKYFAAVRETPVGIERLDISPECWGSFAKSDLLAYWQTIMPKADQKKKLLVDDEVLCTLFERLADAAEPVKIHFRFVLGLILMRRRLVIYEETRHDDGKDIWIVRMKGKDQRLELVDPKMNEQQVAEVSGQLGQILNEEL
jgi:hypothetical protein